MNINHKIRKINEEEIVILKIEINFNEEFALDFLKKNENSGITEKIRKYLKNNFNDKLYKNVLIVINGITIGLFSLSNILGISNDLKIEENFYDNQKISYNLKVEESNVENLNIPLGIVQEKEIEEEKEEIVKEEIPKNNNVQTVTPSTSTNKTEITVQSTPKQESNVIQNPVTLNVNGEYITIALEEYVIGVVGAEMPASFNIEALKAQSVAARTYALKRVREGKILIATESNQTYNTNEQLRQKWGNDYTKYYNKIKEAVYSTEGKVMTYQGNLIDAVFHSTSNGQTEDAKNVWGYDIPYLKSVESYDEGSTPFLRTTTVSYLDASSSLGIELTKDSELEILSRTTSGRINTIKIDDNIFSGKEIREKLKLRSTDFTIVQNEDNLTITTKGYGHGVGMSQYGAGNMANNGHSYANILKHYYQSIEIVDC